MRIPIPTLQFFQEKLKVIVGKFVRFTLQTSAPNPLLTMEAEEMRRKEQLLLLLEQNQAALKLQEGIESIVTYLDTHEGEEWVLVTESLSKLSSTLHAHPQSDRQPQCLQESLGLTETCLKKIYGITENLYEEKNFSLATNILYLLTILNPFVYAYWQALSQNFIQQKQYQNALAPLAISALLESKNPEPHIYACECYLAMGDAKNGKRELDLAKEVLDDQEPAPWKEAVEELSKFVEPQTPPKKRSHHGHSPL